MASSLPPTRFGGLEPFEAGASSVARLRLPMPPEDALTHPGAAASSPDRGGKRGAVLGYRIENDDDPFDPAVHDGAA